MHLVHGPFVSASCVFSTSTEGNTPRGVPHRVQSNVDAAETPSDGLMPQSHLATLTSFPGAAHHMCTVPLCIFYALLCTSMHFHAFSMHFFNTNVSCTGRSFPPSHDRQVKKTIPTKLCVLVSDTRSRTHGLGHTVSDTRSRTHGLGLTASDTRSRTHSLGHTVSDLCNLTSSFPVRDKDKDFKWTIMGKNPLRCYAVHGSGAAAPATFSRIACISCMVHLFRPHVCLARQRRGIPRGASLIVSKVT
jgi:hypothetical protein